MDTFILDVRQALRALRRRPAFAWLAALTLAAGMGVSTVAFSAVNALVLKPFSFERVERLAWIFTREPGNPHGLVETDDYEAFARHARSVAAVAAEQRVSLALHEDRVAKPIWGLLVSGNYFDVLRPAARVGRAFTARDAARADDTPVVISERFWRDHLAGLPDLAGRSITINNHRFAVAGVLPDSYRGPGGLFAPDVWVPMEQRHLLGVPEPEPGRPSLTVVARLRDEATQAQVEAELAGIYRRAERSRPASSSATLSVAPFSDGHPEARAMLPSVSAFVMTAAGVVALVACFNVAGLLIARATERRKELAIRAALGASRGRLARQLLMELMLVAALGGAGALALAFASAQLLSVFAIPAPIPQRVDPSPDWRLVAFTALLIVGAGLAAGLAPAMAASRVQLHATMKGDSGWQPQWRRSQLRNLFVGCQLGGATLFVSLALLFAQHFIGQSTADPGFPVDEVLVLSVDPALHGNRDEQVQAFYEGLAERLAAVPGVRRVALGDRAPFFVGFTPQASIAQGGADCGRGECPRANVYHVGPGYAESLGFPVLAGRDLSPADAQDAVLVNRAFLDRFHDGRLGPGETFRVAGDERPLRIVGAVANVTHRSPTEVVEPHVYRQLSLLPARDRANLSIVVRSSGDPRSLVPALRAATQDYAPGVPLRAVQTMRERMEVPLWAPRSAAVFFVVCGLVALLLASIGLFGVTNIAVSQRLREFGIRRALGASSADLARLLVADGGRVAALGTLGGMTAAWLVGRVMSGWLVGLASGSPLIFVGTAGILSAVAGVAFAGPMLRATRVAPAVTLKNETT